MIFLPYADEKGVIDRIQGIRNEDYVLLRLTPTMIEKNNLDANELFREMLLNHGIVNYDELRNGGHNGISYNTLFFYAENIENTKLKFYKVNNKRGDRRFSIETIKRKMHEGKITDGDLLYISIYDGENGEPAIFIVNLTRNTPTSEALRNAIGVDPIKKKFEEIKPILSDIIHGGYYDNSKGEGEIAPKDVGDTLESLLKVPTNNNPGADLDGLIELKSKVAKTLDTLFTLRPLFDGTEVADFEPNDRNRVAAFARLYGYDSDKHPNASSLYITIGSEDNPQNGKGFYLEIDEAGAKVNLMRYNLTTGRKEITAYWFFSDLKHQLTMKHPSTLWIKADSRKEGNIIQFKYREVEFTRTPQFMTFLELIKAGIVTYDWRGYTSKKGAYKGKNHGNAWRIKPAARDLLFGHMEVITL